MLSVKHIKDKDKVLAIVVKGEFKGDSIHFFSEKEYSQQLGYMKRPLGYKIPNHIHKPNERKIFLTQEVLFIKSGMILVEIYNREKVHIQSVVLVGGDIIHLIDGGHGIQFLQESEILEVKQGPYMEKEDKEIF